VIVSILGVLLCQCLLFHSFVNVYSFRTINSAELQQMSADENEDESSSNCTHTHYEFNTYHLRKMHSTEFSILCLTEFLSCVKHQRHKKLVLPSVSSSHAAKLISLNHLNNNRKSIHDSYILHCTCFRLNLSQ
jgi:hypothetical protein